MTEYEAPKIRPGLSRLSWKSWFILVLTLSAIGSQLAVWGLFALHSLYVGNPHGDVVIVTQFFGPPVLLQLSYVFLLSLTVNIFGALAILAFFAIRRRLRPS